MRTGTLGSGGRGAGGWWCCTALPWKRRGGWGGGFAWISGTRHFRAMEGGEDAHAISLSGSCWYPSPTLSRVLSSGLVAAWLSPLPIARYPLTLYLRWL